MKIKKILYSGIACLFLVSTFYVKPAIAGHAVTTCSNSCVITYDNGDVRVDDCCGGTVTTKYPKHTTKEK